MRSALRAIVAGVEAAGANLTVLAPDLQPIRIGRRPETTRVRFRDRGALDALLRRDHLALAEAYLAGRIEIEGDLLEAVKVTEAIAPDPTPRERLAFALRLLLRNRERYRRESIAFHYDRPPAFFLAWLDRWRSYSHGRYASPDESVGEAQERKLRLAVEALALEPGMRVFEMGCGWGPFVEYAGLRGIRVHAITNSREQFRFVRDLIRARRLPCEVEFCDFARLRPGRAYDAAVFMGTLEHFRDYRYAARFLARHLRSGGRLYADFCAARTSHQVGAFLARYIWPGTATYVDVPKLLRELIRAGFNVYELGDDTRSYAYTVRDWARTLERERDKLGAEFGEPTVRAFLLFLFASQHFLMTNRTQAYHLVAGAAPAGP
jgi:cyclopropane-fatty-acyl-phospholipid synthase